MKPLHAALLLPILTALSSSCASSEGSGAAEASREVATSAILEPATCGSIARLHRFGDLYLAGQPAAADFEAAREAGVKTVINLRPPTEQSGFDEGAAVKALGLAYLNLPISGPADLTDEALGKARTLLNNAERPILVHCASANRVGAIWIPWRVLDGGLGIEEAVAEAKTIGLRTPELEARARDYVTRQGSTQSSK